MKKLLVLLFVALLFRLLLAPLTQNNDVYTQAAWGEWIYENGFTGTYANNQWKVVEWPNHPPLIMLWYGFAYHFHSTVMWAFSSLGVFIATHRLGASYIPWFFKLANWYGVEAPPLSLFLSGIFFTIKLLPILADLLVGWLIYHMTKKINFSAIYLFSPFSWYLSAIWGQSDQVGALFLLISFLLLENKSIIPSALFLAVAANFKPTVLIMIPLYLFFVFKKKINPFLLLVGGVISLLFVFATVYPFDTKVFDFTFYRLPTILFNSKVANASASGFNFWFMLFGSSGKIDSDLFLWLPFKTWGYIMFTLIHLYIFRFYKNIHLKQILYATFVISAGGWMFMTNMYERYLFLGVVSGLLCCIFNKKYFKYWIAFSTIYLINMMNSWTYPPQLEWIRQPLSANNWLVARIFSITNVVLYVLMVRVLHKEVVKDQQSYLQ